jgi:hypothetical protein
MAEGAQLQIKFPGGSVTASLIRLTQLQAGERIYQSVEKIRGRSNLVRATDNIYGDYSFLRVAIEGDAEVAGLVFHPEIRISRPLARIDFRISETEARNDIHNAPLTLLGGCDCVWPIDAGVGLAITAIVISRGRSR